MRLRALSALVLCSSAAFAQIVLPTALSHRAAARFLEQASWGPTPEAVAHVRAVGMEKYLDEQFALAASPYDDAVANQLGNYPIRPTQDRFWVNAVAGPDQLRQRVGWALGQIWVVSSVKLNQANQIVPYIRLMQQDAFENYRTIMRDVTVSPAMGRYLDMVNNEKPDAAKGRAANENYARELLQLFTIGLAKLNPDGTAQLDSKGEPVPTYGQEEIQSFARVFTGWTFAPKPGAAERPKNPANWEAPMVPYLLNHDYSSKTLLDGKVIPGGLSASDDLDAALDNIFEHANVGPFVCRNLIQHLVTGAPTPGYVERVARVFADNGHGERGDLKAVVKAILLDSEARAGDVSDAPDDAGHLREPVQTVVAMLRATGATVSVPNGLTDLAAAMGQTVFAPVSVFNYYSPGYAIDGGRLNAPEFQLLSPSTAMLRADLANTLFFGTIRGVTLDLAPFVTAAAQSGTLLDLINARFYHDAMPAKVRDAILVALGPAGTARAKAQQALYLATATPHYQVER